MREIIEMSNMTDSAAQYTKHNNTTGVSNKVRAHESIWDHGYDVQNKSSLVRGKSTSNIAQLDSTQNMVQSSAPQPRVGSHISAKIRELQLCQERRKRHVSESDTLEAKTSAETFKDARQIVFLEDFPSLGETQNVSSDVKALITKPTANTSFVPFSSNPNTITTKSSANIPLSSNPNTAKSTANTSFVPFSSNPNTISAKSTPQSVDSNSKTKKSVTQVNLKTKDVSEPANQLHDAKNTAAAPKVSPPYSRTLPPKFKVKTETTLAKTFLPPPSNFPPVMVITPPASPVTENGDSESEILQETILFERPQTIRIRPTSESDQTLELTVTVSQKPTQSKESSILSPTRQAQFSLDEDSPKPSFKPRRSFVFPNFLRLLPTASDRRNSEPLARVKPPRLQDVEETEILSFKLEAVAVNAAFLLARAQDFCGTVEQLIQLEDEIERTQRALDDVEVMAPVNMKLQVARATRALNACKMLLEERAPSIEMQEIAEQRRRSSTMSCSDVRSVSMRVMKLNKEEEKRRYSIHDGSP